MQVTKKYRQKGQIAALLIGLTVLPGCFAPALIPIVAVPAVIVSSNLIGRHLVEADRLKAEAAAQRASAERAEKARWAAQARYSEIERRLRIELAHARSETDRARAYQRDAERREAALRDNLAQARGPVVTWSGTASGSAQSLGPAEVAGRRGCERVRELAIIQGREVIQFAFYCRDERTGRRVRV